jgi:general secretion pathway protein G
MRHQKGFTLVELMVVLAIIGVLAGIAVPSYNSYLNKAKQTKIKLDIAVLEQAVELYQMDTGKYPSTSEGLQALMQPSANDPLWMGPYLKQMPLDPAGHPYKYQLADNRPQIISSFL